MSTETASNKSRVLSFMSSLRTDKTVKKLSDHSKFKGTIEKDTDLPNGFEVLSSVDTDLPFDQSDRVEMAVLKVDSQVLFLVINNRHSKELYSKVKRILEDFDYSIDDIYYTELPVITFIYKNIFSVKEIVNSNNNLSNFNEILDDAIQANAANINIFYVHGKSTRITFDVYKQIKLYRSVDSASFLEQLRSYYSSINSSDKSSADLNLFQFTDASSEYYLTQKDHAGKVLSTRSFRLRYNHVPSLENGIDITIRVNEVGSNITSLPSLGYDEHALALFDKLSKYDEGIIFWTGSTSSGKTTTISSLIKLIADNSKQTRKILTIEDPVEIIVPGSHPTSLFSSNSMSASSDDKDRLWSLQMENAMRRAPDVVFVGEIRNPSVAESCVRLALSGHLTLSTLHAYDPFQALNLLTSVYNVNLSTLFMDRVLRAIVSQKLVPVLCQHCAYDFDDLKDDFPADVLNALEHAFGDCSDLKFERFGSSCEHCDGSGRIGLRPIYEIFTPNDQIIKLLMMQRFSEARKVWLEMSLDDGFNGVSFVQRAVKMVKNHELCAMLALDKVIN